MELLLEELFLVFTETLFQRPLKTLKVWVHVTMDKVKMDMPLIFATKDLLSIESFQDSWRKEEISNSEMAEEENQFMERNSRMKTSIYHLTSHSY